MLKAKVFLLIHDYDKTSKYMFHIFIYTDHAYLGVFHYENSNE